MTTIRWTAVLGALSLCPVLIGGCEPVCEPGETQECVCSGARPGAQACVEDGKRWSACDCGGSADGGQADGGAAIDAAGRDAGDGGLADAGDLPPNPVGEFAATRTPAAVALAWVNPVDGDLDHIVIRRSVASFPADPTSGEQVYVGLAQSFTDYVVEPLVFYYYSAFSIDEGGGVGAPAHAIGVASYAYVVELAVDEVVSDGSRDDFAGLEGETLVLTFLFAGATLSTGIEMGYCDTNYTRAQTTPVVLMADGPGGWDPGAVETDLRGAQVTFEGRRLEPCMTMPAALSAYVHRIDGHDPVAPFVVEAPDRLCVDPAVVGDRPTIEPFECPGGNLSLSIVDRASGDVLAAARGSGQVTSDFGAAPP